MELIQIAAHMSTSAGEGATVLIQPTTEAVLSIGDWINMCLLIVTAAGLIFAGMQLKQSKDINRASLVKELYLTFYRDNEIRGIFYQIEWSDYTPYESIKLDSKEEQQVDALLSFFEVVCDMYYRNVLTKEDLKIFDYEMHRTYEHPGIQEYLTFLAQWQKERNIGESYSSFKRYCAGAERAIAFSNDED